MYTFTLTGSHGKIVAKRDGIVISADPEYADIIKIDVDEWCKHYPGQEYLCKEWDVLDFGGWTKNGTHFEPERGAFDAT